MYNIAKALSIIITIAFLISCSDDGVSSNNHNMLGIISGRIVNTVNEPISAAEVYTVPPTEVLISNHNGDFSFVKVPPGNYKVFARKVGFPLKFVDVGVLPGKSSKAIIVLEQSGTQTNPPDPPGLLTPENSSRTDSSPLLEWELPEYDTDDLFYIIYLDNISNPINIIQSNITNTNYRLSGLDSGKTYYWKIGVGTNEGTYNESEIRSFMVE